jgi:hypothetical protein
VDGFSLTPVQLCSNTGRYGVEVFLEVIHGVMHAITLRRDGSDPKIPHVCLRKRVMVWGRRDRR